MTPLVLHSSSQKSSSSNHALGFRVWRGWPIEVRGFGDQGLNQGFRSVQVCKKYMENEAEAG